ncbi:MAG TPA: O-antigen ligase family protein [Pseudonocardiaceae bacterium]|nr:O-antigen ligase family protein [Pseudonocardiaceae bacterium]
MTTLDPATRADRPVARPPADDDTRPVEPVRRRQRADGTTLLCVYCAILFLLPSHLVIAAIPLALAPSMLVGMGLGLLWFCAQLVNTVGMAKGRSLVRTSLFLFGLAQLATYGYATYGYLPSDELNATDRSVVTIMGAMVVGIMAVDSLRGLSRIDKLLRIVVYGCVFVAVIGLIQFFFGFDPTHYLVIPGLRDVGDVNTLLERSIFRRPSGTAGHPIEFGVVCAIAVPLCAHYAFRATTHGRRSWGWWLSLAMLAMGAMVSLSRSAILGLLAAGLVLLPTWPARRQLQTLVAAALFTVLMRLFVPGLIGTLISLFSHLSGDPSIQHRTETYARASVQIAEHPWLGRGFGTYLPSRYGPVDNQYLGTLIETGFVGLAALIFVLVAGAYAAIQVRRAARDPVLRDLAQTLLACLAVIMVADATYDAFGFIMATGMCFLLVGVTGALWRTIRDNPSQFIPVVGRVSTRSGVRQAQPGSSTSARLRGTT